MRTKYTENSNKIFSQKYTCKESGKSNKSLDWYEWNIQVVCEKFNYVQYCRTLQVSRSI